MTGLVESFRDDLVAAVRQVPELAARTFYAPPDVTVAPAAWVGAVHSTWRNGLAIVSADVTIVTDAADHAAARGLDQTLDRVLAVLYAAAGFVVVGHDERTVTEPDERDLRPGRTVTVTRSTRPCP